jgi:hypothetical protein
MIHTMILILIILAAFSLLWWGINALSLPQPIKVVVLVILGLIALLFIYNMFANGGSVPTLR